MSNREELVINTLVTPNGNTVTFGSGAPTTGTYKVGDIVINNTPTATGAFAWTCSAAGTPGTWNTKGSFLMPDGTFFDFSNAAVAAAGAGQSTFAVIADQVNAVTGADGTKGVALPAAAAGRTVLVINTSASAALPVSPVNGGNDAINGLTAGTGVFTMGPGKCGWFVPTSATQWYVDDAASVAATSTELDYTNVTTLGTVDASKAVTADANKDVTGARNFTVTGASDMQTLKVDAVTMSPLKWVDVAATAALLDAAGTVNVIAGVAGDQYKVREIVLVGGGTNFGAGGDRTIVLTDGTTTWTTIANADVESAPAASLRWGDAKVPFATGTSNTASVAGQAIRFAYAGGTTDHGGTGSITFSVCLEKIA